MRINGLAEYYINTGGADYTNAETESEYTYCLVVSKDTYTDFEKLFYETPFSEVYRRYANICAVNYRPLSPKEIQSYLK